VIEGESHFLEQQICDGLVDVGLFPAPIYSQALESYPRKLTKYKLNLDFSTDFDTTDG